MLNPDDFVKRLEFIMENFGLNASSFADKIGVQRSSISHILSGRNKPSLDFILKILDLFPELNLYWLLNGNESYLKNNNDNNTDFGDKKDPTPTPEKGTVKTLQEIKKETDSEKTLKQVDPTFYPFSKSKEIQKIVCFYTDGTFDDYQPNVIK